MDQVSRTGEPLGSLHITSDIAEVRAKFSDHIGRVAVDLVDARGYTLATVHLSASGAKSLEVQLGAAIDAAAEARWEPDASSCIEAWDDHKAVVS